MSLMLPGNRSFAAPPRTGTTTFLHREGVFDRTGRHGRGSGVDVTLVRRPDEWLRSYYSWIGPSLINEPIVDRFGQELDTSSFHEFVWTYVDRMPGAVSEMFEYYCDGASEVYRTEDLGGFAFNSNPRKDRHEWNEYMRDAVLEADDAIMQRFYDGDVSVRQAEAASGRV